MPPTGRELLAAAPKHPRIAWKMPAAHRTGANLEIYLVACGQGAMMNEGQLLVGGTRGIDALTVPSAVAVTATFTALDRTVDGLGADCRAVLDTLHDLDGALRLVSQGGGAGQDWSGFGLAGLPIAGAIRAVKVIASQYVKQHTGVPLDAWVDLVASASSQFESYLGRLEDVARLAQRQPAAGSNVDVQQAEEDLQTLQDLRWQTQAWKQVLGRVAQAGEVVDAVLQAGAKGQQLEEPAPERGSGLSGSLQRRLKDVQARTVERSGDLQEWVLQPFVEVRDRVRQLPAQVDRLAQGVALLEVLLDLEIAEIRACLDQIPPADARVVGIRVAASVILPELAQQLAQERQRALTLEGYLARLGFAHDAGTVGDRVHALLSEEYRKDLDDSRLRLAALEARADAWRRDGQALLDACVEWSSLQLDVLAARRLAEQREADGDRRVLLMRERARVEEARRLLAAL